MIFKHSKILIIYVFFHITQMKSTGLLGYPLYQTYITESYQNDFSIRQNNVILLLKNIIHM